MHPDRSSLPYRVGFPVLVANMVQAAQNESKLAEGNAAHTGVLAPINGVQSTAYHVEGPGNLRSDVRSGERGVLAGIAAPRVGQYLISASGGEPIRIGASLIAASGGPLACAAFCLLLLEWWFYQKRPASPAAPAARRAG
jgi:Ca-activated chloride channel homolog